MGGRYVKGLNGLRALCALFILWGHVAQRDFCLWEITALPVPECCAYVFFVISGLLAGYRMGGNDGVICYYKKKAHRLLPLYYSYLLVSVLLYVAIGRSDEILDSHLLYYLFLVPQIPFCAYAGIKPLVHLWFVGAIVLFYALFPLFASLKEDRRKMAAWIIAFAWLLLKLALRVFVGTDSFWYRIVGVTGFDVLFAGVWVGLLLKERDPKLERGKRCSFLGLMAGLLFLCSGLYGRFIPAPIRVDFIAGLVLVFIVAQQKESPVPNLENRFLDWLGTISYEFYVSQILVIILLSWGYTKAGIRLPSFFIYLICTMVVTGVAWCYHKALGLRDARLSRQTDK